MSSEAYSSFSMEMVGRIEMAGYMNVAVAVTLQVDRAFPDLLKVQVAHADLFHHNFTASVRQLADGRSARMSSCNASVEPLPGRRIAIQARTWHWQIPVEVSRDDVDEFLAEAEFFLASSRT